MSDTLQQAQELRRLVNSVETEMDEVRKRMTALTRALAQIPDDGETRDLSAREYTVKVRAADTEDLGRMLKADFSSMPGVRSTRTTVVLGTLKESSRFPIPEEFRGLGIA